MVGSNIKLFILVLFLSIKLFAGDVIVDASVKQEPNMRKIFDAFRSANSAPENRLKEINSSLVRMFSPLSARNFDPYGIIGDSLDVVKGKYPNFTYDFSIVDRDWVGPVIEQNTRLNLGYCYMPESLNENDVLGPPNNYQAWEEFNYQWAKHWDSLYSIKSYEVWNEPDYYEFFSGSRDDYFEMYKYAVKGIKRAVPDAKVGGPALAGSVYGWIDEFLDFTIANNLPLNFVSYHAQNNGNGFNDEGSIYHTRYNSILQSLSSRNMDSVEIHLNEFSYNLHPSQGSQYDKVECAAWFASTFKFILNNLPRLARFNKTIVDNGELLPEWAYLGLITTDNIPKAKFNFFKMYAKMPYEGVSFEAGDGLDAMASIDDSTLAVLIWNKAAESDTLNLTINNIPLDLDSANVYLIDSQHSSYFDDSTTAELERIEQFPVSGYSFSDTRPFMRHSIILYLFKGKESTPVESVIQRLPKEIDLNIFPNPFNSIVKIVFNLPLAEKVDLVIYNLLGQEMKRLFSGYLSAGYHSLSFNSGNNFPGGIYLVKIKTRSGLKKVSKMVLIK